MTKVPGLAIAGLLLSVAANGAVAQTNAAGPRVRLQVGLDYFDGSTKTGSVPFFFSLALNQKGTLRVAADPVKATSSESCPSTAESGQFVGTQIEATVVPIGDNRFGVSVVFSERAHVGCRDVNGLSIPVFSNQTIARTIDLINGEFREIVLQSDTLRNTTTKMNITLTVGN